MLDVLIGHLRKLGPCLSPRSRGNLGASLLQQWRWFGQVSRCSFGAQWLPLVAEGAWRGARAADCPLPLRWSMGNTINASRELGSPFFANGADERVPLEVAPAKRRRPEGNNPVANPVDQPQSGGERWRGKKDSRTEVSFEFRHDLRAEKAREESCVKPPTFIGLSDERWQFCSRRVQCRHPSRLCGVSFLSASQI